MRGYDDFLKGKVLATQAHGFDVSPDDINPMLFDWQREIVRWALRLGRAALFEECGLGKTGQQLEWAKHVVAHTGGKVLVLTPLAVAHQTVGEGVKFDVPCAYVRSQAQADESGESILIANYEMLDHFDESKFVGIVTDESSILKNFTGKTKRKLLDKFSRTPFRLACTATPAPNDHLELGNHADFLGLMPSNEMIARWFINDTMQAGNYRLKRHAEKDFWRWVTSWAVCISKPSDLGPEYDDDRFNLPALHIHEHLVGVDHTRAHAQGRLFLDAKLSATDMWREKRETCVDRAARAREIFDGNPDEPHIIWCDTNYEADALKAVFPEAVEVRGSDSLISKETRLRAFSEGREQVIITKPTIAGHGLNWQHCRNQVFVGITYSFERFYQALRRSYRYMVEGDVNVHLVSAESEGNILDVLKVKQKAFQVMQVAMNEAMAEHGLFRDGPAAHLKSDIEEGTERGDGWTAYLGDCVSTLAEKVENESVDFTVFSPPFSSLYIYTDSIADMGNSDDDVQFFEHFAYLTPELLRVSKVGSRCAVHCKDLPLYKNRDGAAGLRDFPGDLIESFEDAGWIYERWVTIWKDPVLEMQRTKNHGLLHRNFAARGEVCRQGMADFVLVFRKVDGTASSPQPASWLPVQPDIVKRAIDLWTNEGEMVICPDVGMGREYVGLTALKLHDDNFIAFSFLDYELDVYDNNLIQAIYDVTMPGRNVAVRCRDIPLVNLSGKVVGLHNMASEMIRWFSEFGFTFQSRVAMPDGYSLVVFRKWTDDMLDKQVVNKPVPPESRRVLGARWNGSLGEVHVSEAVRHPCYVGSQPPDSWDDDGHYSIKVWQKYASPVWFDVGAGKDSDDVWFDVRQTRILNYRQARGNKDERHICPLQLDVIEKGIGEYTKPGDVVLSTFAGVGSEGVTALKMGRDAVLIELKEEYFEWMVKNMRCAELEARRPTLFDWVEQNSESVMRTLLVNSKEE